MIQQQQMDAALAIKSVMSLVRDNAGAANTVKGKHDRWKRACIAKQPKNKPLPPTIVGKAKDGGPVFKSSPLQKRLAPAPIALKQALALTMHAANQVKVKPVLVGPTLQAWAAFGWQLPWESTVYLAVPNKSALRALDLAIRSIAKSKRRSPLHLDTKKGGIITDSNVMLIHFIAKRGKGCAKVLILSPNEKGNVKDSDVLKRNNYKQIIGRPINAWVQGLPNKRERRPLSILATGTIDDVTSVHVPALVVAALKAWFHQKPHNGLINYPSLTKTIPPIKPPAPYIWNDEHATFQKLPMHTYAFKPGLNITFVIAIVVAAGLFYTVLMVRDLIVDWFPATHSSSSRSYGIGRDQAQILDPGDPMLRSRLFV